MNTAPEIVSTAFRMLTALGLVLGGLLVCVYFIKRFLKKDAKKEMVLGGAKYRLLSVNDKFLTLKIISESSKL